MLLELWNNENEYENEKMKIMEQSLLNSMTTQFLDGLYFFKECKPLRLIMRPQGGFYKGFSFYYSTVLAANMPHSRTPDTKEALNFSEDQVTFRAFDITKDD
ncbi:hypothetical protein AVEN_36628-1 [Araneus ventricosus]|uniref:Uncharacterized protein n=1 Tax=Araneus ventricosus TaxID=182803 RepID=A0A4Y2GK91_ARAVE|nr:hypothetical protein AVEN_252663-1 [Araneus ventricosus]GBM53557.1 hypothetical protein AVEN_36628-1 [Araneus ventricosus]